MDIVKTLPTVISIHAPTRGATPGPATVNSFSLFQSTLPRGERPSWGSNLLAKAAISIHAPTRGATLIDLFIRIFLDNFNPRSHEGSDDYTPNSRTISSDFNPRSHEGSDPACFYPETGKIISIHAPTRGATDPEYHRNLVQKKFQSTLPRGERLNCTMTAIIKLLFQSTLPRGERRGCQTAFVKHLNYFNPRSHEGSDDIIIISKKIKQNFNPRSHEGSD